MQPAPSSAGPAGPSLAAPESLNCCVWPSWRRGNGGLRCLAAAVSSKLARALLVPPWLVLGRPWSPWECRSSESVSGGSCRATARGRPGRSCASVQAVSSGPGPVVAGEQLMACQRWAPWSLFCSGRQRSASATQQWPCPLGGECLARVAVLSTWSAGVPSQNAEYPSQPLLDRPGLLPGQHGLSAGDSAFAAVSARAGRRLTDCRASESGQLHVAARFRVGCVLAILLTFQVLARC